MESLLLLLGLAIVVFASTNVDTVFVLLGFFADPKFRTRDIVIGQCAGIGALYSVSVVASLISLLIPKAYIGLLGVAPVLIGAKKLWDLARGQEETEEELERHPNTGAYGRILSVVAVTVANGGDNIGIYTPLFATRSGWDIAVIGMVFAVMTAVWLLVARWMVKHPLLGAPICRYGHRVVPFVLIGLGVLVLYEAGSFRLLPR
jgi:cadmium resistance protein CadD (predicted permease)